MSTFVLVHGAWHGGWCWKEAKRLLEEKGYRVYTPTMTGLGERKHLISKTITIDTLVKDIANVIKYENLDNVILVGHSFGGAVISGVAELAKDKIKQLIYLDAAILEDNESMFDCTPAEAVEQKRELADKSSNGLSFPLPSAANLGITDKAQWEFVEKYLTPHPLSTYDTKIKLSSKPGAGFNCSYIICTDPIYHPLDWAKDRAKKYNWNIAEINTGHDAMITDPVNLVRVLVELDKGTV